MGSWDQYQFDIWQRRSSETTMAFPIVPPHHSQETERSDGRQPLLQEVPKTHASEYILYNYLTTGSKVTMSSSPNKANGNKANGNKDNGNKDNGNKDNGNKDKDDIGNDDKGNDDKGNDDTGKDDTGKDNKDKDNKVSSSKKNTFTYKEIPSWKIYYTDQRARGRLVKFTLAEIQIPPDDQLNKLVSLSYDICISQFDVDAVVNSTTETYEANAGVSKILHAEAGMLLKETCQNQIRLSEGDAVMTFAFKLSANYVIHTVGPHKDGDEKALQNCYENCLNFLLKYKLRTIVFPCISTGLKMFNREKAATVALRTVRTFLESNREAVDRVIFSLHNLTDISIYRRFTQVYFPVAGVD